MPISWSMSRRPSAGESHIRDFWGRAWVLESLRVSDRACDHDAKSRVAHEWQPRTLVGGSERSHAQAPTTVSPSARAACAWRTSTVRNGTSVPPTRCAAARCSASSVRTPVTSAIAAAPAQVASSSSTTESASRSRANAERAAARYGRRAVARGCAGPRRSCVARSAATGRCAATSRRRRSRAHRRSA